MPSAMVPTYVAPQSRPLVRGQYATVNLGAPELKAFDTFTNAATYWATFQGSLAASPVPFSYNTLCYVQNLNNVATGTDLNQRIGRKIVNKSVLLRYTCVLSPYVRASADNAPLTYYANCRIILVWDSQPNGVLLDNTTINLLLQTQVGPTLPSTQFPGIAATGGATSFVTPFSPLNLSNRQRFRVLYDREFALSLGSNTSVFIEKFVPLGDIETVFQDNNPTPNTSSITHGALYLVALSDQAPPGINWTAGADANESVLTPFINGFARLKFTDP